MSAPITLTGRLAADPELRFTPTGKPVAKFAVITSRRKKDGDDWVDVDKTFWPCVAWDQMAEQVAEHLQRGHAVVVTGQAYENSWEKDGEKRSRIEVRVDAVGQNLRWPPKTAERAKSSPASGDPWANGGTSDEPPF